MVLSIFASQGLRSALLIFTLGIVRGIFEVTQWRFICNAASGSCKQSERALHFPSSCQQRLCVYWFIVRQDPSSLARGYDPLYSSSPLASLDGFSLFPRTATCWILTVMPLVMFFQPVDVRLSFPFVWMPWKLTRDYNMADFQAKICEKFNINSLTYPRVKMSRADRNPWLAKMGPVLLWTNTHKCIPRSLHTYM
jgi:hypothetical protein